MRRDRAIPAIAVVLFASTLHAQPLSPPPAAALPERVMACLEWAGADAAGPTFAASDLGRMLAEPDVRQFTDTLARELDNLARARVAREAGLAAHLFEPLAALAGHVWRRPAALALIDVGGAKDRDAVQAALVVHAGDRSPAIQRTMDQIASLLNKANVAVRPLEGDSALSGWSTTGIGPGAPPLSWGFVKDYFVVALGGATPSQIRAAIVDGKRLSDHPEYQAVRGGLGGGERSTPLSLFVDAGRLRTRLLRVGGPLPTDQAMGIIAVLQAVGLQAVGGIGAAMQLADGDLRFAAFIHAPGERRGLLKLLDQKPLDEADLRMVPADADLLYATNFDAKGWLDSILHGEAPPAPSPASGASAGGSHSQPDAGPSHPLFGPLLDLPVVRALREDLLPALGDTWILYDAPRNGGIAFTGLTLCVETTDAARARRGFSKVVESLLPPSAVAKMRLKSTRCGAHDVTVCEWLDPSDVLPLAPAWGASQRWLAVGLFPQMAAAALDRLAANSPADSILSNETFHERRALLPKELCALTYYDAPKFLDAAYGLGLPMAAVAAPELRRAGLSLDLAQFPPRAALRKHVRPTIGGTHAGAAGFLMESRASLPLLTLSIPESLVFAPPVAVMLAPTASVTPGGADRAADAAALREVGRACLAYARDHDGRAPATLEEVGAARADVPLVLVKDLPPPAQVSDPARCVMVYIRPSAYGGAGTYVCFVDGRVEWRPAHAFEQDLERTMDLIAAVESRREP